MISILNQKGEVVALLTISEFIRYEVAGVL